MLTRLNTSPGEEVSINFPENIYYLVCSREYTELQITELEFLTLQQKVPFNFPKLWNNPRRLQVEQKIFVGG